MASSTSASVGIAYLLDAPDDQIGYCIRNMTGTVTGMICDGGKVGCALRCLQVLRLHLCVQQLQSIMQY